MFRIIVTPPEEEESVVPRSDAIAELRALGVAEKMIQIAIEKDKQKQQQTQPTNHSHTRLPHVARPPISVPTVSSSSSSSSLSTHASMNIDAFKKLVLIDPTVANSQENIPLAVTNIDHHELVDDADGDGDDTDEFDPELTLLNAHTQAQAQAQAREHKTDTDTDTDAMMIDRNQNGGTGETILREDEHMNRSPSPELDHSTPQRSTPMLHHRPSSSCSSTSSATRIPSTLFRDTFTDSRGYLLPPIANPDLGPSLTRADSFWVGPEEEREAIGERTNEEYYWKQQQQQQQQQQPPQQQQQQQSLAASKTKSIYAHALQPASSSSSPSTSSSSASSNLVSPSDWSTVLDATLLLARHELSRSTAAGNSLTSAHPNNSSPPTHFFPTSRVIMIPPSHDSILPPSLKRKQPHLLDLSPRHSSKYSRVDDSTSASSDTQLHATTATEPTTTPVTGVGATTQTSQITPSGLNSEDIQMDER